MVKILTVHQQTNDVLEEGDDAAVVARVLEKPVRKPLFQGKHDETSIVNRELRAETTLEVFENTTIHSRRRRIRHVSDGTP